MNVSTAIWVGWGFLWGALSYWAGLRHGRAAVFETIRRSQEATRCPECGAVAQFRLLHQSGCEHGWPNSPPDITPLT